MSSRAADRAGRVASIESGSFVNDPIDIRGFDRGIAQGRDTVGPELIGRDEKDIGGIG